MTGAGSMSIIRAAAVQFEHVAGSKDANFARIESFSDKGARQRVQILAFPECCITGYWFFRNLSRPQLVDLAEPVPDGTSTRRLLELARRHGMTIGAGLVERDGERLFNTYVVAMPDGEWRRHRKIQAFEHEHISAGNEYTVFDTPHGVRVGVLICYDNNIIENVRITALAGAQILLAPHQTCGTAATATLPPSGPSWSAPRAKPGSCAGSPRGHMTTACSSSSPTASESTTTRSGPAMR
jgi:predicted amidohydrolase